MKLKFYKNQDNNHCLQCCVRMIHNSVERDEIDLKEIDEDTSYDPALYTWTVSGASFLSEKFNNVKIITNFDYEKLVKSGEEYLKQFWSKKRFNEQKEKSSENFQKEIELAKIFLENGEIIKIESFKEDFLVELVKSHFIIMQVDHSTLYQRGEGGSHYVLVYSYENNNFNIHDPGLPPRPSQRTKASNLLNSFKNELIAIDHPDWWDHGKKIKRNTDCPCGSGENNKNCHTLPKG